MNLEGWFVSHATWKTLEIVAERLREKLTNRRPNPDWRNRINRHLQNEAHVLCEIKREPYVEILGSFSLTERQTKAAIVERRQLASMKRPNDPHAVLAADPLCEADPPILRVQTLDYASVLALRRDDLKPQLLSSSAVIVCRKARVLLLHKRGDTVDTYPGYTHTLGGAYIPPGTRGVDADRLRLRSTLEREVHEETQITVPGDAFPPMMLSKELATGFIQLVFLGFGVTEPMLSRLQSNWEGTPQLVPYDNLPGILRDQRIVPSGKAHLLAWLAMGAPNAGRAARFDRWTAHQLFDVCVDG